MHRDRAIAAALGALVVAVAVAVIYRQGPNGVPWFPGCSFHRLTGLSCPGCGMTRAAHAAMHGRMAEAFRFNPLGMILLPLFLVWLGCRLPRWIRGDSSTTDGKSKGATWVWWIFGLVMAFWVLRNIPIWPFRLLAPH